MKQSSPSIQQFREGIGYKKIKLSNYEMSKQCYNSFFPLKKCLGNRVLAIHLDDSGCDLTQFRAHCPGVWRRFFIEQTYREQINRQMYPQKALDEYHKKKNLISQEIAPYNQA